MKKLSKPNMHLLIEATRRYTRFHQGEDLNRAWCGLGTASQYKTALEAGLMEFAKPTPKGTRGWLLLTDAGVEIVKTWIDMGLTHEEIEQTSEDFIYRVETPEGILFFPHLTDVLFLLNVWYTREHLVTVTRLRNGQAMATYRLLDLLNKGVTQMAGNVWDFHTKSWSSVIAVDVQYLGV